ncbi:hypothetical protein GQ53DRAFT_776769 [Thozetella sp. PMI_491]|nr:hypothetical protein GQ53DRAFT_776769 [Thozetella sp. PMI_491]
MKLIVTGATGYVGSEVVRQSLQRADITSVVAVARKKVTAPSDAGENASKLKSVVIKDYAEYPDEVKREFAGANACIWTVAITPARSRTYAWDVVKHVCQTSTLVGLKAMYEARPAKPFRFLYMSGFNTERDQTKTPSMMPQYSLMRGETENQVLAFAAEHAGEVEASVAKCGLISGNSMLRTMMASAARALTSTPTLTVQDLSAAMIDQALKGFEKEEMSSEDLTRIGKEMLAKQK